MTQEAPSLARATAHHSWVAQWLAVRGLREADVEATIHPDDEMLQFSVADGGRDVDAGTLAYFVSGLEVAETLERIVRARFREPAALGRLLDFGCGFGRITRFVVRWLASERIWVSDLVPEAVAFQERRFGVRGFVSASEPEGLVVPASAGDGFDLIYVGSLFTHLPESTFARWFDRLVSLLRPGGLLVLSVHDEELMPPALEMPECGIRFVASSESRTLDHAQYGSTWVTERFVASVIEGSAVRRGGGEALEWRRLPRGLCAYQDLYLIGRGDGVGAAALALATLELDTGAEGQIERCALAAGALELEGWAIHRGAHRVARIDLYLDGERVAGTAEWLPRPEVAEALELAPDEAAAGSTADGEPVCGWRLSVPLPPVLPRSVTQVVVEAVSDGGFRRTLYAGGLERLLHLTARENYLRHRQRVYELAEIIEQMKESRFWRLRRHWFRLKRVLGLTDEDPDGPRTEPTDHPEDETGLENAKSEGERA